MPTFATLFVGAVYALFVTYGTGVLLKEEFLSVAFDSLGKHLLNFETSVDSSAIGWEGMPRDGKMYMYFGPFPALFRIIPNLLFPQQYGRWARVSCLVAGLLTVIAFYRLIHYSLQKNPHASEKIKIFISGGAAILFGLGTPILFLVSCSRIYHESLIWGVCGSLWSIYFMTKLIDTPSRSTWDLFNFSMAVALTLLSRLTFALPFVLFLGIFLLYTIFFKRTVSFFRAVIGVVPLVIGTSFQLWYNYGRFGSIFQTVDYSHFYIHPEQIGGVFSLKRIPSALYSYFFPHFEHFLFHSPFFQVVHSTYFGTGLFMDWKEEVWSLTVGSLWLLICAGCGLFSIIKQKKDFLRTVAVLCLTLQCIIISSFFFITTRYSTEYLPAFSFLMGMFLSQWDFRWTMPKLLIAVVSCAVSFVATPLAVLQWNGYGNGDVPREYKRQLLRMFNHPAAVPSYEGTSVSLTEYPLLDKSFTLSEPKSGGAPTGDPLEMLGQVYDAGFWMHAVSSVTFEVPQGATRFIALAGISDYILSCAKTSLSFSVTDEQGRVLSTTGTLKWHSAPQVLDADIQSAKKITITVDGGEDGIDCDHGVLANPRFIFKAG